MYKAWYVVHYNHAGKRSKLTFDTFERAFAWAVDNRDVKPEIERVSSEIIWSYKDSIKDAHICTDPEMHAEGGHDV